jgi:hypothetical protein
MLVVAVEVLTGLQILLAQVALVLVAMVGIVQMLDQTPHPQIGGLAVVAVVMVQTEVMVPLA